jgi:hypothetical protein
MGLLRRPTTGEIVEDGRLAGPAGRARYRAQSEKIKLWLPAIQRLRASLQFSAVLRPRLLRMSEAHADCSIERCAGVSCGCTRLGDVGRRARFYLLNRPGMGSAPVAAR